MAGGLFAFLFVAVIVVVVVAAVLSWQAAKQRREEFAATARQREWTYTERDDRWCERFRGPPFGRGSDRRAINVLGGTYDGRAFVAFDYRYSTHSTDSQGHSRTTVHPYSVLALNVGTRFPRLSVAPEGFFSRAVGRITNRDIELESEDFNRAFTVTADDRKFASDVLHPQMMEYLLRMPDLGWEFEGDSLVAVRAGSHTIAEVDDQAGSRRRIVDRVPEFVWRCLGRPAAES